MEDNFRNTLIIISAIVIGAIFVHGLWTIRKNKNPYKLKTMNEALSPQQRDFDPNGFDQDGVGQVKVKTQLPADELDAEPVTKQTPIIDDISDVTETIIDDVKEPVMQALYDEPVIQPKPVTDKVARAKVDQKIARKRDQMEINFGQPKVNDEPMPSISTKTQRSGSLTLSDSEMSAIEPEVLSLTVMMPEHQMMSGAILLPSLLTLGLKYGEMNIFHRHQDNAGHGAVTFSLANMMNPGAFDLDTMETFVTQGVTLFMMLPNQGNAFEVYEQMLAAAKQLTTEFNAQLLDEKRNVMTKQTEQHYVARIRTFEIKHRSIMQ